jgi:7 transmembrane sweet-taste receptor of 3 GCPR
LCRTSSTEARFDLPNDCNTLQLEWTILLLLPKMNSTLEPSPSASVVDENLIRTGIRAFVLTLTGLTALATVLVADWLRRRSKERIVLSHQPIFLYTICFGLFIWESSVIPLSLDDGIVSDRGCDIACVSYEWLQAMGFTVTFSGLFSKLWRINRIFRCPQFQHINVQAKDVMTPFCILCSFNFTLLLLMTILDPPQWVRKPINMDDENFTYGSCQYGNGIGELFVGLVEIANFIATLAVIWQAYRARNISADFSETWPLAIVLLNWIQINIIGIPTLSLIGNTLPTASYFLGSAMILARCCTLLLAVFCPLYFHPSIRNPPPALGAQIRVTGVNYEVTRATLPTESFVPEEGEPDEAPKVADVGDDHPIGNGDIGVSNSRSTDVLGNDLVEEKCMSLA